MSDATGQPNDILSAKDAQVDRSSAKPAAPEADPTGPDACILPPTGVFPATILRYSKQPDEKISIEFELEWNTNDKFQFVRTLSLRSERGRKSLGTLRRCARLKTSDESEELQGKRVSVSGARCYRGGNLTWVARRYHRLKEPKISENAEPEVEGDAKDALVERLLSNLKDARFIRDGDKLQILLPDQSPIPIDYKSHDYAALQYQHTGVGTVELKGKIIAQRVLFKAMAQTEKLRRVLFSHAKQERVLVPVEGGKILQISTDGFTLVDNGTDGIWLEHPRGKPYRWEPGADPCEGLKKFEELLVETQAIPQRAKRCILGVALGIIPLTRQLAPTRPILELNGQPGHGKTTGAARYLRLHKLGKVQGDYSLPQAKRDGDVGLIVRDNVETANLTRSYDDFFLFGATEAEWARVGVGRTSEYPVIAVTTIEGLGRRPETSRRLLPFEFQLESQPWSEKSILAEIDAHRALIFRGIAELLRCVMAQKPPPSGKVIPMPGFVDYCNLVYQFLRAWEQVGGKPEGFADSIFADWHQQQSTEGVADSAGPYPRLLELLIAERESGNLSDRLRESISESEDYTFVTTAGEHKGRLLISTPTNWLTWLKRVAQMDRDVVLPAKPEGLRKRLKQLKPEHGYLLLTDKEDKSILGRHGTRRLWGILEIVTPPEIVTPLEIVSPEEPSTGSN